MDGRTDGQMTKLIVPFNNFEEAPKNQNLRSPNNATSPKTTIGLQFVFPSSGSPKTCTTNNSHSSRGSIVCIVKRLQAGRFGVVVL